MKNALLLGAGLAASCLCAATASATPITFRYTGHIVDYKVSTAGVYGIIAFGAQGGAGDIGGSSLMAGGDGARVSGEFALISGEELQIAVGGEGGAGDDGGGGGGGSFVVAGPPKEPIDYSILAIAGGGGGGGLLSAGQGGQKTAGTGAGGSAGQGTDSGGGGGGYQSTGKTARSGGEGGGSFVIKCVPGPKVGCSSPLQRGTLAGGAAGRDGGVGGFGGGGGGGQAGGGGGGYSGGAGGSSVTNILPVDGGSGGDSILVDAKDPSMKADDRAGNGLVELVFLHAAAAATVPSGPGSWNHVANGQEAAAVDLVAASDPPAGSDPVPEPGSLVLLATGLFGLAALRRRGPAASHGWGYGR